jgi:hypothetical protein
MPGQKATMASNIRRKHKERFIMPKSLIMRLRHIMMVAPPAEPGGDGQQSEPPSDGEKTFSQSDVNRIVEDRLRREQAKYADYDDLKAKAAKFDE